MLTYTNYELDLRSIPGEICLTFYVCGCPCHCPGCSSPWLWQEGKYPLTTDTLLKGAAKYPYATCILLMGGDGDIEIAAELGRFVMRELGLKAAIYSGREFLEPKIMRSFDYVKIGPWRAALGPLNSPTTNQSLWRRDSDYLFTNITSKFWTEQNKWHEIQERHIMEALNNAEGNLPQS